MLRVGGPDRILFVVFQRRRHVADRRLDPGVELFRLHHEAQIFLGGLRVLRILEDHLIEEELEFGRLADRPDRHVRVVDIRGHLFHFRILRILRRVVNRNAVVRDEQLTVEERLVVVRIEPR